MPLSWKVRWERARLEDDDRGGARPAAAPLIIMWGTGTGSEVMSRIAAPMVGGMGLPPC